MLTRSIALGAALLAAGLSVPAASHGWTSVSAGRGPQVIGSNRIVSQRRPVSNFRVIEVRDAAEVVVRVGPSPSLVITADDNLLPLLRTDIRDGNRLVIESSRSYRTRRSPRITITVPRLSAFALRGSGDAVIDGVNGSELALALSGSGNVQARGRSGSLSVAINGSGDVDTSGLVAGSAAVAISGSGDAIVRTNGALTGVIRGSGTVHYIGRPTPIAVRVAGSGSVSRAR